MYLERADDHPLGEQPHHQNLRRLQDEPDELENLHNAHDPGSTSETRPLGPEADLFESFVGAIIGAMVLAMGFEAVSKGDLAPVILPMLIAAGGIICSIIGTFFVSSGLCRKKISSPTV